MNPDDTQAQFGELRSALAQPPSEQVWRVVCDLLAAWPGESLVEVAIPHGRGHLDHDARWRATGLYRPLRFEWAIELLAGAAMHPGAELCDAFVLSNWSLSDAEVDAIASCKLKLRWFHVYMCRLGDEKVSRLLSAPPLAQVERLGLYANELGAGFVEALLSGPRLSALVELDLGYNRFSDEDRLRLSASAYGPLIKHLEIVQRDGT